MGHSYCVAANRELPREMALVGEKEWEVTAVAPSSFYGDLRFIKLERRVGETYRLEEVPAFLSRRIHMFFYGSRIRQILNESWDIVHCWEEPYVVAGGQVAHWAPPSSRLVFWTGQNIAKDYPPPFSWIEKYCMDRCAAWITRGELGIEALVSRGFGDKPHCALPLGVDTLRFRPDPDARSVIRHKLGWDDCGIGVVGYSGRFVEEKGLKLLTATLDRVSSPWRALFVGGGPLEDWLRKWARTYGDRVRVVTGVSHDGVPAYLNAMDALCAPSRTTTKWREVFGRMIIEAFACGVPVIASDSGEIPNVAGDAAMIVAEWDENAWLEVLGDLLENRSRREELSLRGLERARTAFSWSVVARKHLDFVSGLVNQRS